MDRRNDKDPDKSGRSHPGDHRRERYNGHKRDVKFNGRFDDRRPDSRKAPVSRERDSFEYVPTPRIPTGPRGFSRDVPSHRNAPDSSNNSNDNGDRRQRPTTTGPPKRPRDGPRSPRPDLFQDRKKPQGTDRNDNRGIKKIPSGPRGNRLGRDSFVPVGGVKPFTRPTEVLKSRSRLGFNDEPSDEEEPARKQKKPEPKTGAKVEPKKGKVYLQVKLGKTPPYERLLQVGEGTYGKVYKAKNNITGRLVALKRLRLETEKEGFPITAMREVSLLQSFQNENVSGLLETMVERNMIYMIFDYAEHDLTALLAHPAVELTDGNRKDLFRQLLQGINYLHEKRIMHRDIKGSNILVDRNGVLKITDFGLARKMKNHKVEESPQYTNRVITLWYRPPELLMGATDYGREVDMWGIGCLLIELFTKRAAFQGNNEITQLQKVFKVMGTPSYAEWPEMDDLPWYHIMKPESHHKVFNAIYDKHLKSASCIKLCEGLLASNPAHRFSAKAAIGSDWFKESPKPERLKLEGLEELHEFEVKRRRKAKAERGEKSVGVDRSVLQQ